MQVCRAGVGRPRKIWLTRHGESQFNVLEKIGGNSALRWGPACTACLAACMHASLSACMAACSGLSTVVCGMAPPFRAPGPWHSPLPRCVVSAVCSPRGQMYAQLLPEILSSRMPKTAEGKQYPVAGGARMHLPPRPALRGWLAAWLARWLAGWQALLGWLAGWLAACSAICCCP